LPVAVLYEQSDGHQSRHICSQANRLDSLRNGLRDDDSLGNLELGDLSSQSLFQVLFDLSFVLPARLLEDDRSPDLFAVLFVGNSE